MLLQRFTIPAVLIFSALAGCTPTTPPGKNGGTEQLRASLTWDLRRAGVPDDCIEKLSRQTLGQVFGITTSSPRGSLEWFQQRQQIRTAVAKDCGPL